MKGKKLARMFDLAGNRIHGQPTQRLLVMARALHQPVHARKREGPGGWWEYVPPDEVDGCRQGGVDVLQVVVN